MKELTQRLSWLEKTGYSLADAAANFVFTGMILFQANFYTDVFGITAGTAATILLCARLWDAAADPLVGILADRTNTRWGKFRPWILYTALPWCLAMVLAYTTPTGWSHAALVAYATCTNILLMCIYSMNNMPYTALGGVMTADLNERAKLNSFRFVAVNIAQVVVGSLTLPLVAKFSIGHTPQYGWQMTMTVWAALCLVLFLVTFATTRERIQPPPRRKSNVRRDLADLFQSGPWLVMFLVTLCHFCALSFRGGALYNYYHHYADKAAMYDWAQAMGLTASSHSSSGGALEALGYIVHGDRSDLSHSNVADVFNSIINLLNTAVPAIVLTISPALSARFGKKAVAICGFAMVSLGTFAFYFLRPTDVNAMVALTIIVAALYAPTIPLIWTMYADVADYSEWQTGRRFTGITFATICFALKCGLALGSSAFLWVMALQFHYDVQFPDAADSIRGFRFCSGIVVGFLFLTCAALLANYQLNKRATLQLASDLTIRRSSRNAALKV